MSDSARAFRQAMTQFHTWAGLLLGSILFAVFWMGSLSVYDREIDRWMIPSTRLAMPAESPSLDRTVWPAVQRLTAGTDQWTAVLPSERQPVIRVFWRDADRAFHRASLDPGTGARLPEDGSDAGTGFIFPFHYSLHLEWRDLGYWLVGIAAMAMLALLVSGIVIHRKLIAEFFIFRPEKSRARAVLDLHNLSSLVALPFHAVISFSGLVIFMGIYFPDAARLSYGHLPEAERFPAFQADAYGQQKVAPAGPAPQRRASLDDMAARAESAWQSPVTSIRVLEPDDAAALIGMRRSHAREVGMTLDQWWFRASDGAVVERFSASPVMTAQRLIGGLHFIQFDHHLLRALYFGCGLLGTVMIATGFLFWLDTRRLAHRRRAVAGFRLVEVLTVASVTGVIAATVAFFVVNRLLPADAAWPGLDRAATENLAFWLVWLAAGVHAAVRPMSSAWREQLQAIAALAVGAVLLDGITTGDWFWQSLTGSTPYSLRAVAVMDLALLAGAVLSIAIAARIGAVAAVADAVAESTAAGAIEARAPSP